MKRLGPILGAAVLLGASLVHSQTTAVSATVVDSDSVTWANGNWSLQFVPNPSNPNPSNYTIGGTPLSPSVTNQKGVLSTGGALSVSVYQTAAITPVGSSWKLTVCPNAITACGTYTFTAVGTSMNISSALTPVIPAPRFKPVSGAYGYNDTEAVIQLIPGSAYWNVTDGTMHCYSGIPTDAWGLCTATSISLTTTGSSGPATLLSDILNIPVYSAGAGLNQLTGDVAAGPGTGSQVATLATVNSDVGTCGDSTHYPEITLNAKGLATACTAISSTTGITQLTGDVAAGPGSGSQAATLAATGSAGSCGDATHSCGLTFDSKGRETARSNNLITINQGTAYTTGTNGGYTIAWDGTIDEDVNTGAIADNTPTSVTLPYSIPTGVYSCVCSDNGGRVQSGNDQPVGCNVVGLSAPFTTINVNSPATSMSAYCRVRGH